MMATYSKSANGAFPGKVGSVIGSSWRNVDYLKGLSKKSSKAATEPQLAQRTREIPTRQEVGREMDIP